MSSRPFISTWTKFKGPTSGALDPSIFAPLFASNIEIQDARYGRIAESPGEYMLVVIWPTEADYKRFMESAQHDSLRVRLKAESPDEPTTQVLDFGNMLYWHHFGVNTEFRTVYFPNTTLPATRDAVRSLKGLVTTAGHGIGGDFAHMCPYRCVPTKGWVDAEQTWNERKTVACIWVHNWKDEESEKKFKATGRRMPKSEEDYQPLALEAFEGELEDLGALAWEDIHVDFQKVPRMVGA
ncbi:Uu.00g074890.m01.CDS01 [Anthostomella pinea]|uniref:Uu.00g074890.m01.CDS01 n=1 Tax=Anthostomella pinea TaxID=933095 RepID=A0AAI8VWA7_9PEZI|nr:Uu.00g074890.m01.CDS01 [Anthostomella pinea]